MANYLPPMPYPGFRIAVALTTVYLVWGSTYLAIRIAIETIPPFLMGGIRFTVAGLIMYVWASVRGARRPAARHLLTATIAGVLLLGGGNGAVVWAEQFIPSGAAALVVGTVPMWIVVFDWARPEGRRPAPRVMAGLLAGFIGASLLIAPADLIAGPELDPVAVLVVVGGALSWAAGSVYSRYAHQADSPLVSVSLNMIAGGLFLTGLGTLSGEWSDLVVAELSPRSLVAFAYLVVFGAIIAYTAYLWLLRNASLATTSTYAYVNPVVAVLLGWAVVDEPLSLRVAVATAVIVGAVLVITTGRRSEES